MPEKIRMYHGKVYKDPGGCRLEPNIWWDEEPLLDIKPWHPALFWKYLIHLAVWDTRGRKVKRAGEIVELERGQLYHSLRWLGHRPGWSKNRVAREVDLLEADGRIRTEAGQGGTLITIVNYDPYQDPSFYFGTPPSSNNACKPEKRDSLRDTIRDRANHTAPSEDRHQSSPPPGHDSGQILRRGRDKDGTVLMESEEDREDARARGATPTAAPARPDTPDDNTISWRSITATHKYGYWFKAPDICRADMFATALQAGPPPDNLHPELRADALELGFLLPEPEPLPITTPGPETPDPDAALNRLRARLRNLQETTP